MRELPKREVKTQELVSKSLFPSNSSALDGGRAFYFVYTSLELKERKNLYLNI